MFYYIYFFSLLILTNLKCENDSSVLFKDLKDWLQSLPTEFTETEQPEIIKIRDQLCAGFFLIYCKKFEESKNFLLQVQSLILPEYFDALQSELNKRNEIVNTTEAAAAKPFPSMLAKYSQILTNFLLFMKKFAHAILEKMKTRHGLLVAVIRSNAKNFVLFCKKLIEILLKGMRIL